MWMFLGHDLRHSPGSTFRRDDADCGAVDVVLPGEGCSFCPDELRIAHPLRQIARGGT